MYKVCFKCTFLTDVILHASSNTEGNIKRLDFIPGSNFLGIVARAYKDFEKEAKTVFHDGKVRFNDAHIVIDGDISYHVPFSWYAAKGEGLENIGEKFKLYNEYFITQDEYEKLIVENNIQLQQQRVGYFAIDGKFKKLSYIYRQKSAYDRKKRRSKKSQMFGYFALPKDLEWIFSVEFDDDISQEVQDKVITLLTTAKYLGKARNAEYGNIKIEKIEEPLKNVHQRLNPIKIDKKYYIFLYANSRLALMDKDNINSYTPSLQALQIENNSAIKIDYEKSYIRTNRYTPYVDVRANFDFERLIIDKGSVIAVEVTHDFDVKAYQEEIANGIGLYLSEGFGKVIVNPTFITNKNPFNNIIKIEEDKKLETQKSILTDWLEKQKNKEIENYELLKRVKEFIDTYKNDIKNKKSQWGQIRSLCNSAKDDKEIFEKLLSNEKYNNSSKGFLLHGKAKEKWSKNLIDAISEEKKSGTYLKFMKLLSIYAPKEDDKKEAYNG